MIVEPILLNGRDYAYVVVCEESKEAAIVDPGQADPVIAKLEELGAKAVAIWVTNHHLNHTGGIAALKEKYPEIKVYGHEAEQKRTPNLGLTELIQEKHKYGFGTRDVEEGVVWIPDYRIQVGKLSARVLHTPGYTAGGLCYHVDDALFTGEVLSGGGTSRNFENNVDILMKSLNWRIARLPRNTKVYFGTETTVENLEFAFKVDGENERLEERLAKARKWRADGKPTTPSTVGEELETNPFLQIEDKYIHDHVIGEYFEPDEPFYVFSRLLQMRERGVKSPKAETVGPADAEAYGEWGDLPIWKKYEYHLYWRRDWNHWLSMPDLERRRAVHDPDFWNSITDDQKKNFLVEADWQELRHVKGKGEDDVLAREEKLSSLKSLAEMETHLSLTHVQIYWLMSTRKLPGWLVGGKWQFDQGQVDRFVEDFGGLDALTRDIEDQIAIHRAAQDTPAAKPKAEPAAEKAANAPA